LVGGRLPRAETLGQLQNIEVDRVHLEPGREWGGPAPSECLSLLLLLIEFVDGVVSPIVAQSPLARIARSIKIRLLLLRGGKVEVEVHIFDVKGLGAHARGRRRCRLW
jgi:hypothetical protein